MTALQPPWALGTGANDDEATEWAPSNEPLSTFGVAEPGHGDVSDAAPESEQYGRDTQRGGTTPDPRMNLLTNVREVATAATPIIEHHHVMETIDRGTDSVRMQTFVIPAQPADPTIILQENPDRVRAFVKVVTVGVSVLLMPLRGGGASAAAASGGTGPSNSFTFADTDGLLKIETQAGIEAIAAAALAVVTVYEELSTNAQRPGVAR